MKLASTAHRYVSSIRVAGATHACALMLCARRRGVSLVIFVGASLISGAHFARVHAQDVSDTVTVDAAMDALAYGIAAHVRATPQNQGNEIARIPILTVGAQLRPELRARLFDERLRIVVRPRFWATVTSTLLSGEPEADGAQGVRVDALYAQYALSPSLAISYGRQTFEWGAAQFINASNRLFHLNATQRTAIFSVIGKELLRINWTYGTQLSTVMLAEFRNNGQIIYGQTRFDPKALLKVEYVSESGSDYIGLVFGGGKITPMWLGLYGSVALSDGLTVHTDASLSFGSVSLHPVRAGTGPQAHWAYERTLHDASHPVLLGVLGAKYTFLNGLQLGLEWIANTAGYSRGEIQAAYASVLSNAGPPALIASNRMYLADVGLETLGRHQLYFTLLGPRITKPFEANSSIGYLLSLTDGSGRALFYLDVALNLNLTAYLNLTVAHGALDAEHAAFSHSNLLFGFKYAI